ncbi:MAG: DUF6477 family protein [Paracoccaceae bacterium]
MTSLSDLASLRRPRLLMQAARLGIEAYVRDRDLCRVLRIGNPPSPERALRWLLAEEDAAEARRQAGDGGYSSRRHLDLLIALLAEARLL